MKNPLLELWCHIKLYKVFMAILVIANFNIPNFLTKLTLKTQIPSSNFAGGSFALALPGAILPHLQMLQLKILITKFVICKVPKVGEYHLCDS